MSSICFDAIILCFALACVVGMNLLATFILATACAVLSAEKNAYFLDSNSWNIPDMPYRAGEVAGGLIGHFAIVVGQHNKQAKDWEDGR